MDRFATALGISGQRRQGEFVAQSTILLLLVLMTQCLLTKEHLRDLVGSKTVLTSKDPPPAPKTNPEEGEHWSCPNESDPLSQILLLPEDPENGKPLRLIAVTRRYKEQVALKVLNQAGEEVMPQRLEAWGHIPRALSGYYSKMQAGNYRAILLTDRDSRTLSCLDFAVSGPIDKNRAREAPATGVWRIRRDWTAEMEDLFSVFVAKLFYVRPGSRKGWKPMHQATQDPYRNILYGILGLDEDNPDSEAHVKLKPDCGDAPYLLRAYFAWKMRLPFMFNLCKRGTSKKGARCFSTRNNLTDKLDHIQHPTERFNAFARQYLSWVVHAGNPRTHPDMDTSDFYPIKIDGSTIRPGVVFVDAGGHVILVSQRELQLESSMGALYGVDAHPDRTVTHKRFASGTFVFNSNVPTDGFKAFRPVVYREGNLRFLSNREINENGGLPPFSDEQIGFESSRQFYNMVYALLNPRPVNPRDVLVSKVDVLYTAMLERVMAVQLGVEYMAHKRWFVMSMPNGPSIFQTEGPWETYSTPARDMRCFLAIDDVMKFPGRMIRDFSLYDISRDENKTGLVQELSMLRDSGLEEKKFQYRRSDGSDWTLTLRDVVLRQKDLEMAYNPNDCPETRWAAPKDSDEYKTCRKTAPLDQLKRMRLVRRWFASRRRPDQR